MNWTRFAQVVGAVSLVLLANGPLASLPLKACAAVAAADVPATAVYVQAESAVIFWDPVNHLEHFIRQASISTNSPDLGFLVPTPETPDLAEADRRIFDLVSTIGAPVKTAPVIRETPWQVLAPIAANPSRIPAALEVGSASLFGVAPAPVSPVTKPQEQDVAGYRATPLDPKDTEAVNAWLKSNGYAATPALRKWLAGYAKAGWQITAFRLIKPQAGDSSLTTRAIRLSFHTDHPYYPYSEPADRQAQATASPNGRALHVAVLSAGRVAGAKADGSAWPGQLLYAGPAMSTTDPSIGAPDWLKLAALRDPAHIFPRFGELTTFIDHSNPRQGTADLYFSKSADPSDIRATIVDPTLPTLHEIEWSNPIADGATLVAVALIAGVPLYCGWIIYSRRRVVQTSWAARRGQKEMFPVLNKFSGLFSVLWGLYISVYLTYTVVVALIGRFGSSLTAGYSTPDWIWGLVIGVPAMIAVAAMAGGVIYCGVQMSRSREQANASRFRESLAIAAMFAGAVGLALSVYFIFHMPV